MEKPFTTDGGAGGASCGSGPNCGSEQLDIDLSAGLGHEFPDEYPVAASTAQAVIALLGSADLAPLAKRSPSLAGYDWANYLRCSQCRVVRALRALKQHVPNDGRVLDYGSYFGNFSTAAAAMGYRVDAINSYRSYARARAVGEHAAHSWCCDSGFRRYGSRLCRSRGQLRRGHLRGRARTYPAYAATIARGHHEITGAARRYS